MSVFEHLKLSDIHEISLDNATDSMKVTYLVPVDDGEAATIEELFELGDSPVWLREAALSFANSVLTALQERVSRKPNLCQTCTGACCKDWDIRVTSKDIEHLREVKSPQWVNEFFELHENRWTGYCGKIKMKETDDGKQCPFLAADGCSIYEIRPAICYEYSRYECGDTYTEDPKKIKLIALGKKPLRSET